LTRPIPPGTPRWGAAWKKATVDNYVSAISGATHLFEEPELWSWWRNWRAWFERHLISGRARHRGELQIEASGAAGTGTPAERLSGWIIPVVKAEVHYVLPGAGS
jgi:hypothetical protein